jgi:hypothetical protein
MVVLFIPNKFLIARSVLAGSLAVTFYFLFSVSSQCAGSEVKPLT